MYVHEFRDRHGTIRRYFRRPGFRQVALPGLPGSPEFLEAYHAALSGHLIQQPSLPPRGAPGTIAATIAAYYQSGAFLAMSPSTREMRRAILERFRGQHGDKRLSLMERRHLSRMLGAMKPFAARNWLKTLRGLMRFAIAEGLRRDDPTADFKPMRVRAGGRHTWTEEEIARYEARHLIGSRARLAMTLLLYTAVRRGDAVLLGPQHVRDGVLSYRQRKTGARVSMPVHPVLAEVIVATASGHLTFLVTAAGKPFSSAGFGNLFRAWCNEAGLPHCSAHGLRKAQARRLAEAGCSVHMIAAITGHKTLSEVQRYAEAADQAALARAAMARIGNPSAPIGNPADSARKTNPST